MTNPLNYDQIINHPAGVHFVAVRDDFVGICRRAGLSNPQCGAALLNFFEVWSGSKSRVMEEDAMRKTGDYEYSSPVNMWIFMPQRRIKEELQGIWGDGAIGKALRELEDAGFIQSRNNPDVPYDRTKQYLLRFSAVNNAIAGWVMTDAPDRIKRNAHAQIENFHASNLSFESAKMSNQSPQNEQTIQKSKERRKEEKTLSAQKNADAAENPKPRKSRIDPMIEAIAHSWKIKPDGYAGTLRTQLTNSGAARGEYALWAIEDPMTPEEVYAFGLWFRATHPDASMPKTPETIHRNVEHFRSDPRYDGAMARAKTEFPQLLARKEAESAAKRVKSTDLAQPSDSDTNDAPDPDLAAEINRMFSELARGSNDE